MSNRLEKVNVFPENDTHSRAELACPDSDFSFWFLYFYLFVFLLFIQIFPENDADNRAELACPDWGPNAPLDHPSSLQGKSLKFKI